MEKLRKHPCDGFNPPAMRIINAFHDVPVVWLNPSNVEYPGVGCVVYNPSSGGVPGIDFCSPDASLIAQCTKQKAQIWVSNQPWDGIVTAKVMIDATGYYLVQGSETDCYFTFSSSGALIFVYDLP